MSRITLRTVLQGTGEAAMRELARRWCKEPPPDVASRDVLLRACTAAMEDVARVERRLMELPRKLMDLLETFLTEPGSARTVQALFQSHGKNFKSRFDLEASLAALQREGFLFPSKGREWTAMDAPSWAVPGELADCVLGMRQQRDTSVRDVVTLQGFLDARYFRDRGAADARAAEHARKIYKMYLMEGSILARLAKLPPRVRKVVDAALLHHGGIMPLGDLDKELDSEDRPDAELLKKCLEDSMTGTVTGLDVARFGIQPEASVLVVFHEVILVALRDHAARHQPVVGEALCCGVDLTTNAARFLRELSRTKVQFTTEGELFKASQKRIASLLLPVPGGLLNGEAVLDLLFRFCLHKRLIDRRGERSLRPTPQGAEFERAQLQQQLRDMLAFAVEERGLPGEHFHQARMRRVFLRLLRRAEPEQWQEIQFLPFLARNAYLSQLDTHRAEDFFAARFQGGGYTPTESLQQLERNLLVWIKRRLFPLGVVDIGMRDGRPVAIRLSRLGAELLEAEPAGKVGGTRSSVIVNPDFELLLFPGDDLHEVVHVFDRFAKRVKSDHVHQFRLERETVLAGLADGISLAQILQELNDRARAPLPQNVLYSLEEWAGKSAS